MFGGSWEEAPGTVPTGRASVPGRMRMRPVGGCIRGWVGEGKWRLETRAEASTRPSKWGEL